MLNITDKKISWLLLGLFAFCLLLVLVPFFERLSFPNKYRFFETDDRISLGPNEPIMQIFTATENNLSQIKILMRNDKVLRGEKLIVSILDENCQETIRESSLSRPNYAPKQYDFFTFEPISDSQNKKYCLNLLWQAEKKRKDQPNVSIMEKTGNPEDTFTVKDKKNKTHSEESIVFHPGYEKNSFGENIQELARRMSAYKADFLKSSNLILIFSAFLILTILFIVIVIIFL
jgi:hypothetical protein